MPSPKAVFGGEEMFRASPERLYAQLTDLDRMAKMLPDVVSTERVDDHSLRAVVRPGFSFLRGTMRLFIALADLAPPTAAGMNVTAEGIGVSMRVASTLRIAAEGAGSKLTWEARLEEVKGLAAALSPGLIKAAADQVIRHAWQQVRAELGE
ncbi:MAG TPA: SRPBCC domain-containing protein [Pirellulales bacterium]|nr:SRPBCC domain-containing protein [Pirellulales bacterium]